MRIAFSGIPGISPFSRAVVRARMRFWNGVRLDAGPRTWDVDNMGSASWTRCPADTDGE
jgi:hypothetical protein